MKNIFARTCLFALASAFLFENAGFLTHQLNLAIGMAFLVALAVSYFPVKSQHRNPLPMAVGIALMVVGVAVMPGKYIRPGALALVLVGLSMLLQGCGTMAAELPLFAITAAGYGLYAFLYAADPNIWSLVTDISFGFSRFASWLTSWLPGQKILAGPTFLGVGTIVTFGLLFITGSFLLARNGLQKALKALGSMAVLTVVYLLIFSYLPSALNWQLKIGPVPDEAEQSKVQQAKEAHREITERLDSEKATRVIFSADSLAFHHCPLWMPLMLTGLFLIPAYFFFKGAELRPVPVFGSVAFTVPSVLLVLVLGIMETGALRSPPRAEVQETIGKKRVAFYVHGFSNWMRPSHQNYGSRSSGMFGNLPDFVEAMGFNQPKPRTRDQKGYIEAGVLLTHLTDETLRDVDVLMLLNVDGLLDSDDPPYGIPPEPVDRARQAWWQRYGALMNKVKDVRRAIAAGEDAAVIKLRLDDLAEELVAPPALLATTRQQIESVRDQLASAADDATTAALAATRRQLLELDAELRKPLPQLRQLARLATADTNAAAIDANLARLHAGLERLVTRRHEEACRTIWKFVADGGALLVIGDHTFLKKVEMPDGSVKTRLWLNDVLEPFGVKFVNDSAKYFVGGWLQSLENPLHALTCGIADDENEVGMVTGASVTAFGAARPVIVGKFGYSDAADEREGGRGYLGNMDYDVGEAAGEIIIAAEQDYGKGKVLVFGDTSAFANGIITNTGEFCNRVFAWLAVHSNRDRTSEAEQDDFDPTEVSAGRGRIGTMLAIILLASAVVCASVSGGYGGIVAGALAVGLVVAACSGDISVPLGSGVHGDLRLAYVDSYHMPKISKEGWRDDGVMGLHLNLMRNGFYTQNLKEFTPDKLRRADLVVTVAPSVPFTSSDVKTVKQFVHDGGTMILTAGWEDLAATRPLLEAFDLAISYTPLGRFKFPVPTAGGRYVPFWRVWPIEYTADDKKDQANDKSVEERNGRLPDAFEALMPYEPLKGRRTSTVEVDVSGLAVDTKHPPPPAPASPGEAAEVLRRLVQADSQFARRVKVTLADDGSVNLDGEVGSYQLQQKASELAELVAANGTKVHNRLRIVTEPTEWAGNAGDRFAEAELRAKLAADALLSKQNISVSVHNRIARLTGTVASEALKERARKLALTVSYAYPLAVKRNYGKGSFIVIGDSGFWMNKNLEVEKMNELSAEQKQNYIDNINFMRWLLETHVPRNAKEGN